MVRKFAFLVFSINLRTRPKFALLHAPAPFFVFQNSFLTEFIYCAILEVLIPKMQEKWN